MKSRNRLILIAAVVVLFASAAACVIDISVSRKKGILQDIRFSGAYTDCNEKLLGIYLTPDETFRMYKSITEYPPDFIEAVLLQEDKRFYSHNGINIVSIFRSFIDTYIKRTRRYGGSTITMQVAKLKYHLYTKNIGGKLEQIFLALRLELIYSKQDILDAYVNLAPCGKNIEGFEAASFYFFDKGVDKLELSQMLMLCVLPQNPTKRCPSISIVPQDLIDARSRLYNQWVVSHPEDSIHASFMKLPPDLVCSYPFIAPHYTRMLEMERTYDSFYGNSGAVKTTLDSSINSFVKNTLELYVKRNNGIGINNASAVLLDTTDMSIKAYVGSAGFYNDNILGQVDSITSKRSPGSTLKPFIYALAMEQGLIHYDTMLKDTPSSFSEYTPDNYGNTFMGPVKAWYALTQSRNIPAITLAKEIKNPDLYDFLKSAGVTELKEKDTYGLSIVLGSADVTPLELCSLYSVFLNQGLLYKINTTYPLNPKVEDFGKKLLTPESSFIIKKILYKNPYPQGNYISNGYEIGYKTGTSIGFRDCWSVGFFGQYVLCVWIGNFDGTGNNSFLGRTAAAPLFFNIAQGLIARGYVSSQEDKIPDGVTVVDVCSVSGDLSNDDCPYTEKSYFIPGVSPIAKCRIHRKINIDTRTGYRTDETNKPYVQTVVREFWPSDLMELFKQAGLPRLVPPGYPPQNNIITNQEGYAPEITSPLNNTQYVFNEKSSSRNVIILNAVCDADTKELFWFADSSFIAKTKPGEKYEWRPSPGIYELTVLDSKGRGNSRKVTIVSYNE